MRIPRHPHRGPAPLALTAGARRPWLRIAVGRHARDSVVDLLWSASALGILSAGLLWPILGRGIHLACPFRAMTGLPCPTCGGTRAIVALAHLDPAAALAANPLIFAAGCASLAAIAYTALSRAGIIPRLSIALEPAGRDAARILISIALLAQWIYLIAAGR